MTGLTDHIALISPVAARPARVTGNGTTAWKSTAGQENNDPDMRHDQLRSRDHPTAISFMPSPLAMQQRRAARHNVVPKIDGQQGYLDTGTTMEAPLSVIRDERGDVAKEPLQVGPRGAPRGARGPWTPPRQADHERRKTGARTESGSTALSTVDWPGTRVHAYRPRPATRAVTRAAACPTPLPVPPRPVRL